MFSHQSVSALVGIGMLLGGVACDERPVDTTADPTPWYRAQVATETGDQVPFFLRLPDDCDDDTATIVNGEERIHAACRRDADSLVLDFPVYGTRIEARFEPEGGLSGAWIRDLPDMLPMEAPFEASPVTDADPRNRFPADTTRGDPSSSRPLLAGVWRVEFESRGVAKGIFGQASSGVVRGTIEIPSEYGDMRFLAGNLRGQDLYLSTFDGQHATLLTGQVLPDGTIRGEVTLGGGFRERFVAERSDDFTLDDPLTRVTMTAPDGRIDLDTLDGPAYAGQPVIVEIFGTWCSNCNDLTPLLVELYRKHHAEGLEILSVAYEVSTDPEYCAQRVEAYRDKHGVEWQIDIADVTVGELPTSGPRVLSPIAGVPVTIFLSRDGTVHAIYSGFSGPATGAAHQQATAELERLTAEILQSE